ncbi:MAG: indolepyruvate ferredoxin oxidoreductase [Verrucomicrobiales bacterium]|jgi:indolepyruvate ferredoxin oxidoreductase
MTLMDGYTLADRYLRTDGEVLLTGIQALARIPIEQLRSDRLGGHNTASFISGYPGSPLGGFDLELQRALRAVPDLPIVHQPAVNEELGATAVMGSQLAASRPDALYDGVVGLWYGKAPGLDRATDALRHGVFAGSSPMGGAVVLVGDDPACKSSTMPSSSDASLVDLHMPILYPGTVEECIELGLHAVAISRATGLWSAMKIVTPVADGSGTVRFPILESPPTIPTVEIDGATWRCVPSAEFLGPRMLAVEREFREVRLPLALEYGALNDLNRVTANPKDAWLGVVATGYTYFQLLDAFRRLGLENIAEIEAVGIRLLHLRMPVPFNASRVRGFAGGLDEIVIVEEKNPTLEWLIKDALYGTANTPRILGKTGRSGEPLFRSWGLLDADAMLIPLRSVLQDRLGGHLIAEPVTRERIRIPLAVSRTPFFCSGCPHSRGTRVPEGALVGAGTGCHGMTLLMDPERVGEGIGITAMGNEGSQWIGMEPFVESEHLFQNYGDGTFFHSAQLALQNCVAAGKHMTFKILWNSTVAMTGGQDSRAQANVGIGELISILQAYGVSKVAITTPDVRRYRSLRLPSTIGVHDRSKILEVQEDLRATPGVTVLIHDQECAAELRRDRKRGLAETPKTRILINQRICEGCGDCGDVSGCLSVQPVETPFGRKTTIDQASCNLDFSCVEGDCPAFMEVEIGTADATARPVPDRDSFDLPSPPASSMTTDVRIRLAGIGGTGVVTVAQILATAAMFDGWSVHGLDQTGLSQKAGPVVSDVVLHDGARSSSNLIGDGESDVVLAFDGLVAASDNVLTSTGPNTTVVSSTGQTPTGQMITSPELMYPSAEVVDRLTRSTKADALRLVDTVGLAESLTGSPAQANIVLLGVALQHGVLPISVAALERAIELNGVAIEANLNALYWGRRWIVDPETVEALAADPKAHHPSPIDRRLVERIDSISADAALTELLTLLAGDLATYQDRSFAEGFLDVVATVSATEAAVAQPSNVLTMTVARSLHKLLAVKDEYEVARLMLLDEAHDAAKELGGDGARVTWKLHPPMMKALGREKKISLGTWATPAVKMLARGKRLRGTRADVFGRTEHRRMERELAPEFVLAIERIMAHLSTANLDEAVRIAALPDQVRGFEDLKTRRAAEYRVELRAGVDNFAT